MSVWGRFHTSEERYFGSASELIRLKHKTGIQTYIMMQPYVLEPILTLSVGLYNKPKQYADQESAIGQTIGQPKVEGVREVQVGNAQAWYYHADHVIVVWECFFDRSFHRHPLGKDQNMLQLWRIFESWLVKRLPDAETIATPFSDPIAHSIEEYQAFLKALGFAAIDKGVFGKKVHQGKAALT